ncbi:phosphatidylserine decarboxylase [Terracoccus luteus]|uniref:Phosphatidylserine decarboxylase n=1 Tax=Terracoccus luteus TaxID=53356 RepID=A0A839Q529_9MICO|nr:phosphatidylserine decarboxylase [Terracoccus luteus]MBB2987731.1 phosphatidylserine decarboxylase [Terracoccus luteus]MCP2173382.1 phosphatidylserine decarboxylase [Terracoccus luteus]
MADLKIDPSARPFTALALVPTVVAALARRPRTTAVLGLLTAGVTLFFRDPDRTPDRSRVSDPDVVLAPADGMVVHVGEPQEGVAPSGDWQQVSIFLSLLDVHVNRSPYGGRVTEVTHTPGRFLAAYRAASATKNERSEITVERVVDGRTRRVVYRQLVGQLARRIVTRLEPGDEVGTGARMGLMKFGSRMDVFVPPEVVLEVTKGARSVAGETVLGRFPSAGGR